MRRIGFLGGYDKTDMLLYVAKILTRMQKKVLLIDTTIIQKTRYIVPTINKAQAYITEFAGFDVAVGFDSMDEVKQYISSKEEKIEYDMILVDIDTPEAYDNFEASTYDEYYFVTAFDLYSLRTGLEVLEASSETIDVTKIIYTNEMSREENEYLDYLTRNCKVKWKENIINFPIEYKNYNISMNNQATASIKIKGLSKHYLESLNYLSSLILNEEVSLNEITRIIKTMEKEV